MLPRHIGSTPSPLPNHGEISYRGYGPYCPAGGRLVVIEIDGEVIGPLPHAVKHSPTGMTWGYCGSGPADLARSLLIHALGDDARCTVCEGTGEVVYDITTDREIPSRHADLEHLNPGESDGQAAIQSPWSANTASEALPSCPPRISDSNSTSSANLPEAGWTLTRAEIHEWMAHHHDTSQQPW
ncbi:hypothetical protein I553_3703 [Mycobacterium xenopi 4042]|uniref:Uncharacterized protein n=1 Tax=Mycobacterium xenopi 4042 TaxID=1299334 RepID=X7YR80_MYCXE|nr:hypothetical protein I553_3703 [Mycobacterium xenopi 4042]